MACMYCGEAGNWRHERECASNPENMPKVTVTFPCGHDEQRSPFPNDPDGSELAEFVLARGVCSDCFIKEYVAARAGRTPEQLAEEAFERRAAFGPGVEVVNVITGERITT